MTGQSLATRILRQLLNLAVVAGLAVLLTWLGIKVYDWQRLRSYQPSVPVADLAVDIRLTKAGRDLFYLADPQLHAFSDLKQVCQSDHHHHTARIQIYGCYYEERIHLLETDNPYFEGRMRVTAAHEILHAAWSELGDQERQTLRQAIDAFVADNQAALDQALEPYGNLPPEQVYDELHAMIGTQFDQLPPFLEDHYRRYFDDRLLIVAFHNQHRQNFDQLTNYASQITKLKEELDQLYASLQQRRASITASEKRMVAWRTTNPDYYNRQVPVHNQLVAEYWRLEADYNAQVDRYEQLIEDHNQLVGKLSIIDREFYRQSEIPSDQDLPDIRESTPVD